MKIGILGTRGIPNYYGGFEQFAEYLSVGLVQRGHEVVVYNSSDHPYQKNEWNGVTLQHCTDWEGKIGTAGQFIYDFNCILNARKQNFDILLQLGYTSSSIWKNLLPTKPIIVTNMDGLEWKRSKFNKYVQRFLLTAEKWAVQSSNHLVADSIGIQEYLSNKYKVSSTYIAYGAELFNSPNESTLQSFDITPRNYNMLIARMEPENNIEVILDGVNKSKSSKPFLVVGKTENEFSQYLIKKYSSNASIQFLGGIYDFKLLNNLRYYSDLYFHGHSVGGTNPSLLEAMASSACIVAHHNKFNSAILGKEALYFNDANEVLQIVEQPPQKSVRQDFIENNRRKISEEFTWNNIINAYEELFIKLADTKQN